MAPADPLLGRGGIGPEGSFETDEADEAARPVCRYLLRDVKFETTDPVLGPKSIGHGRAFA